MTVMPHWLSKQSFLQPDKSAVEYKDGSFVTFRELERRSKEMAGVLYNMGVREKDHVAILSPNDPSFMEIVYGLSYLGARVVLLNVRLTSQELLYQVNDAEASLLLFEPSQSDKVESLREELQVVSFSDLEGKATVPGLKEEIDLDEVFTMMYTSGTTGNPKAVLHTYGNHWFSAISSALNLGLTQDDKWLLNLPVFHISGFSTLMKNVIYGMTIEFHESFEEDEVLRSMKERGVTMISGVSVMLERLIDVVAKEDIPSSFRCFLLGGGPATKHLLERAQDKNIPVFQTYGMTETTSQIATLAPQDAVRKLGSAGKALATASLYIEAEKGYVGEIMVAGPMVSEGYYKKERRQGRFFATGDMGYLDEEGFLYVSGRKKEMIISGGENIYPAEIENVLAGVEGVEEIAVAGVSDETWGEVPAAFVSGRNVKREAIISRCKHGLARYKHPAYIFRVPQLPRNASNKVLKRRLVEMVEAGDLDELE
ncbi:o-succinylbenzoate--CoA ligase [Salimicrobium halophilum]|uniref:2-succinylbenzoate--CoA ligase n=1 Tax=Salimicrobium halophilum TaxID=86666 RepID=A0A1G8VBG7_9BACI|nr:o-succinylbenzoate--CoA ligase [Salimicrobium halophilum]SDJ63456.1 2-succinylbenzoyl-CoA synthetase [Salimicrobium halophilum]